MDGKVGTTYCGVWPYPRCLAGRILPTRTFKWIRLPSSSHTWLHVLSWRTTLPTSADPTSPRVSIPGVGAPPILVAQISSQTFSRRLDRDAGFFFKRDASDVNLHGEKVAVRPVREQKVLCAGDCVSP